LNSRLGEEQLLKEFNIKVKTRIATHRKEFATTKYLTSRIKPGDTIMLHGGGNFGDLWRGYSTYRNKIIALFPTCQIIIFPQTVNYKNLSLAEFDNAAMSVAHDLTISTRSFDSYNFTLAAFPTANNIFVPDIAFMMGVIEPMRKPIYDVLVLRRTDIEGKVPIRISKHQWKPTLDSVFDGKYTYLIKDWFDYKDKNYTTFTELLENRFTLLNEIMSQAKLIISDRLHATITSLLMGKPHVMINDKFSKVSNTRESAFYGKPECSPEYTRGYYAENIAEAVQLAKAILDTEDL
jgi:exopolysaccharide biosynthesis predicted pyruvyltransferase EpsI